MFIGRKTGRQRPAGLLAATWALLERPDFRCAPAQRDSDGCCRGETDGGNRWSLQNEMESRRSILFVTPPNRNDYGLLATKVMDIECLLTTAPRLPLLRLFQRVN